MTETEPTDQAAECPDACTEHHTYGPDCAATDADYDPNAGMRERYIEAIRAYFGGPTQCTAAFAGQLADAVLAARDVHLNNVRRISKQQTTQLAELYMATKKRAEQAEDEVDTSQRRAVRLQTLLDETRDRIRKIHQRSEGGSVCAHCSERNYPDYTAPWPCPTIAALEPPQETPCSP